MFLRNARLLLSKARLAEISSEALVDELIDVAPGLTAILRRQGSQVRSEKAKGRRQPPRSAIAHSVGRAKKHVSPILRQLGDFVQLLLKEPLCHRRDPAGPGQHKKMAAIDDHQFCSRDQAGH